MDGRAFLDSVRHLLAAPCEPNWRSAVDRAYFAVLHEALAALERWDFPLPAGADLHTFAHARFGSRPEHDLLRVDDVLDRLGQLRTEANERLAAPGSFADAGPVTWGVSLVEVGVDLLDPIEADPARRAAAIAVIQTTWP